MVDAILCIVRGGIAWRQLPVEFAPAATVYAVFARWAGSGGWQRILDALSPDGGCAPPSRASRVTSAT